MKTPKPRWYGHVSTSIDSQKNITQVTVHSERRRGDNRKKWEDNIKNCTGLNAMETDKLAIVRIKWWFVVYLGASTIILDQGICTGTDTYFIINDLCCSLVYIH